MGQGMLGRVGSAFADRLEGYASAIRQRTEQRRQRRTSYSMGPDEAYVMAKLEEVRRVRTITLDSYEPLWLRAILYCAGVQHLRYLPSSRQFEPRKEEDWMPFPVVNYIQNKVQRAVDFFTRNRPRGHCVPAGDHEDDREAAEHGDLILRHLARENDDEEKLDEAAVWMLTTGNVFWKTWAHENAPNLPMPAFDVEREPLLDPEGQPVVDEQGIPSMTDRYMAQRDDKGIIQPGGGGVAIRSDVLGPLHMSVPLAAPRFHEAPWACEITMQPLEKLRMMYPDKADYIAETSGHGVTSDLYQHRILTLLTSGVHGLVRSVDPYSLEGYGIVYHYEEAPTPEFPTGILLVALDSLPLAIDELPLRTRYSWEHAGYHRVPGRFWCRGMVEDLIDPQDQINKLEQFLRVNDDHNAQPTWLMPEQAQVPEGTNANKPGTQLKYKWPFKPEPIQGVSMPVQIIQRRAMYVEDMDEISNVRNVLMGNAPAGVRAGVALNRLREEAEGGFEPIAKRWDRFIERKAEAQLAAVALYWQEPQHVALEEDDGTMTQIRDFVGGMLRNTRRFEVESGSWRPISQSGQQQLAFELASGGFLPGLLLDPEQHRRFLELMGLEGFEAEQSLDYKRAKLENEMLRRSVGWEQVMREPGDDDMLHLAVHAKERKKPEWSRLPNMVKARYLRHEAEHLMGIIEAGGMPDLSLGEQNPEALEGTNGQTGPPDDDGRPQRQPESNSRRAEVMGGSDAGMAS